MNRYLVSLILAAILTVSFSNEACLSIHIDANAVYSETNPPTGSQSAPFLTVADAIDAWNNNISQEAGTCKTIAFILASGTYPINSTLTLDGQDNSFSMIFDKSNDVTDISDIKLWFNDQSQLVLQKINLLTFSNMTMQFDSYIEANGNLIIQETQNVSLFKLNISEKAYATQFSPRINLNDVQSFTAKAILLSQRSPYIFQLNNISALNFDNFTLYYSVTAESIETDQQGPSCSINITEASTLSLSSFRVTSPIGSSLPLTNKLIYNGVVCVQNIRTVGISNFNVDALHASNEKNDVLKLVNVSNASLSSISFHNAMVKSNDNNTLVRFYNTSRINITSISIQNITDSAAAPTFTPDFKSHGYFRFFELGSDPLLEFNVTIKNVQISNYNVRMAYLFSSVSEFASFSLSSLYMDPLTTLQYGGLFRLFRTHDNLTSFLGWCTSHSSKITITNVTLNNILVNNTALIDFGHIDSQTGSAFTTPCYNEPVEAVISNLNLFDLQFSVTRKKAYGPLIRLLGVKTTFQDFTATNTFINMSQLISAEGSISSLRIKRANFSSVSFYQGGFVNQNAAWTTINATSFSEVEQTPFGTSTRYFPFYRAILIEDSFFTSMSLIKSKMVQSSLPFLLLINNTFSDMQIKFESGIGVYGNFNPSDLLSYTPDSYRPDASLPQSPLGSDISELINYYADSIETTETISYWSLVANNKFSDAMIDNDYFFSFNQYSMIGSQFIFIENIFYNVSINYPLSLVIFDKVSIVAVIKNNVTLTNGVSRFFEFQDSDKRKKLIMDGNYFSLCDSTVLFNIGTRQYNEISLINNVFTHITTVMSAVYLSVDIFQSINIANNTFKDCVIRVYTSASLLTLIQKRNDQTAHIPNLIFEQNTFINITSDLTERNRILSNTIVTLEMEVKQQTQSQIQITKCSFINGTDMEYVTPLKIATDRLEITDSLFQDMEFLHGEGLIDVMTTNLRVNKCVFKNIYASNSVLGAVFYISSYNQNFIVELFESNFTNLTAQRSTLMQVYGSVPVITIWFCQFTQTIAETGGVIAVVGSQNIMISTYGSIFDLNYPSNPDSQQRVKPTFFSFEESIGLLNVTSSSIVLGGLYTGSFVKIQNSPQLSFLLNNSETESGPLIDNNQNGTIVVNSSLQTARMLDNIITQTQSFMAILLGDDSLNVTVLGCTFNMAGVATLPLFRATITNFLSFTLENSTFENMDTVSLDNSVRTITDAGDSTGRKLSGVINIVFTASSQPNVKGLYNFTVLNCTFMDITSATTGAISVLSPQLDISVLVNVESSIFYNLTANFGPAITLISPGWGGNGTIASSLNVNASNFTSTHAGLSGGAIFNTISSIHVMNSIFENTSAGYSGGAIFDNSNHLKDVDIATNNTFINNFAGNSSVVLSGRPTILEITFDKSSIINSLRDVSSYICDGIQCIDNATSYSLEKLKITAMLLDEFQQPVFDSSTFAKLTISYKTTNLLYSTCYQGSCTIVDSNITLYGKAQQVINMTFTYSSEQFELVNYTRVTLRECLQGEINVTLTETCALCAAPKFSFHPTDEYCKDCPAYTICNGGSNVSLIEGYWRNSSQSENILACNDTNSSRRCLGGYDSQCAKGYQGPVCMQCDYSLMYARRAGQQTCEECPSQFQTTMLFTLIWVFTYLYSIYQYINQREENENVGDDRADTFIKDYTYRAQFLELLTTYSQIISIVSSFNGALATYFSFIGGSGVSTQSLFVPEGCIILHLGSTTLEVGYWSLIAKLITPFGQWLVLFLTYLIFFRRFKMDTAAWLRVLLMGVTFYLITFPSICEALLQFLFCQQLDPMDSATYLSFDPNISCDSSDYAWFTRLLVIPLLIIWGLVLPLLFYFSIRYKRKHVRGIRLVFGQLVNLYKEDRYYWGIVTLILKVLLLLVKNLLSADVKTRALSTIIILYAYKWFMDYNQPYVHPQVYRGVQLSLYAFIATVFFSFYFENNSPVLQTLSLIAIIFINTIGVGYLLYFITRNMITSLKFNWNAFRRYVADKYKTVIRRQARSTIHKSIGPEKDISLTSTIVLPEKNGEVNGITQENLVKSEEAKPKETKKDESNDDIEKSGSMHEIDLSKDHGEL